MTPTPPKEIPTPRSDAACFDAYIPAPPNTIPPLACIKAVPLDNSCQLERELHAAQQEIEDVRKVLNCEAGSAPTYCYVDELKQEKEEWRKCAEELHKVRKFSSQFEVDCAFSHFTHLQQKYQR